MSSTGSSQQTDKAKKLEILCKLDHLEKKGYRINRRFSIDDDIEDIQFFYDRITEEIQIERELKYLQQISTLWSVGIDHLTKLVEKCPSDTKLPDTLEEVLSEYFSITKQIEIEKNKEMLADSELISKLKQKQMILGLTALKLGTINLNKNL